jgi:hypothetical protein
MGEGRVQRGMATDAQSTEATLKHSLKQTVLAAEVVVHRPLVGVTFRDELAQGGTDVALAGEQVRSSIVPLRLRVGTI